MCVCIRISWKGAFLCNKASHRTLKSALQTHSCPRSGCKRDNTSTGWLNWQRSPKYIRLAEEINSRNAPGASCTPHCREATSSVESNLNPLLHDEKTFFTLAGISLNWQVMGE